MHNPELGSHGMEWFGQCFVVNCDTSTLGWRALFVDVGALCVPVWHKWIGVHWIAIAVRAAGSRSRHGPCRDLSRARSSHGHGR